MFDCERIWEGLVSNSDNERFDQDELSDGGFQWLLIQVGN